MKCPHCGQTFDPRKAEIGTIERGFLKREIYEQEIRDRYESMKDKPRLAIDRTGIYVKGQRAIGRVGFVLWPASLLLGLVNVWFLVAVPVLLVLWIGSCGLSYVNDRDHVKWVEEHPEAARFRPPPSFERR
jgi:hypothetical protein